jgi:hypothetical protein
MVNAGSAPNTKAVKPAHSAASLPHVLVTQKVFMYQ